MAGRSTAQPRRGQALSRAALEKLCLKPGQRWPPNRPSGFDVLAGASRLGCSTCCSAVITQSWFQVGKGGSGTARGSTDGALLPQIPAQAQPTTHRVTLQIPLSSHSPGQQQRHLHVPLAPASACAWHEGRGSVPGWWGWDVSEHHIGNDGEGDAFFFYPRAKKKTSKRIK